MPIPEPKGGESQSDYVSRCMEAQSGEDRDQDQKLAICYSKYRKGKAKSITKQELFTELMFEKQRLAKVLERIEDDGGQRVGFPTDYLTQEE